MSNQFITFDINDYTKIISSYYENNIITQNENINTLQIPYDKNYWQINVIKNDTGSNISYTYEINTNAVDPYLEISNDFNQMVYDVDIYGKLKIDNEQLTEYLKYTFDEDPLTEQSLLNKGILGSNYNLLISNSTLALSKQPSISGYNTASYNTLVKSEGLAFMYLLNSTYIHTLITSLSNSSFSIAFWIQLKDLIGIKGIFNILYQDKQIIGIYFVKDTLYFAVGNSYGVVKTTYIKNVCTVNEKCHFTFTCLYNSSYDSLTLSIYKNIILEVQTSWKFNPNFTGIPQASANTYQMFLGKDFVYNADMSDANLEDFRLYKDILPKALIYDIYNNSTILKNLYTSNILEVNGYKNVLKIGNNNEITDSTYLEIYNFDKTSQTVIGNDGTGLIQYDTGSTIIGNMTNKNLYLIQNKIPRFVINTSGESKVLGNLTVTDKVGIGTTINNTDLPSLNLSVTGNILYTNSEIYKKTQSQITPTVWYQFKEEPVYLGLIFDYGSSQMHMSLYKQSNENIKYPTIPLTSSSSSVSTTSWLDTGFEPYRAFDGYLQTYWASSQRYDSSGNISGGNILQYIQYTNNIAFKLLNMRMYPHINNLQKFPIGFDVYGTNDSTNFDILYQHNQAQSPTNASYIEYIINSNTAYVTYIILIRKIGTNANALNEVVISEIEFYEFSSYGNNITKEITHNSYPEEIKNGYKFINNINNNANNICLLHNTSEKIKTLLSNWKNMSFCFRIYTSNITERQSIFNIVNDYGLIIKEIVNIYIYQNSLHFSLGNGVLKTFTTSTSLQINTWYNIVCVIEHDNVNKTSYLKIYKDTVLVSNTLSQNISYDLTYILLNTNFLFMNLKMFIGGYRENNFLLQAYLNDFRIYNNSLSFCLLSLQQYFGALTTMEYKTYQSNALYDDVEKSKFKIGTGLTLDPVDNTIYTTAEYTKLKTIRDTQELSDLGKIIQVSVTATDEINNKLIEQYKVTDIMMTPASQENLLLLSPDVRHYYNIVGNNMRSIYIPTQMHKDLFYKVTCIFKTQSGKDDNFKIYPNNKKIENFYYTKLYSECIYRNKGDKYKISKKDYFWIDIADSTKGTNPVLEMYVDPKNFKMVALSKSKVNTNNYWTCVTYHLYESYESYLLYYLSNQNVVNWTSFGTIYNDGDDKFSQIQVWVEIINQIPSLSELKNSGVIIK